MILLAPGPVVQHSPAQVNLHLPAKTCRPPDPFTALLVPDYSAGDLPNRDLDPGLARAGCGWELLIDFSVWGRSEVIYSTGHRNHVSHRAGGEPPRAARARGLGGGGAPCPARDRRLLRLPGGRPTGLSVLSWTSSAALPTSRLCTRRAFPPGGRPRFRFMGAESSASASVRGSCRLGAGDVRAAHVLEGDVRGSCLGRPRRLGARSARSAET